MKRLFLTLAAVIPFAGIAAPMAAHAALPNPPAILEWKSTVNGWDDSFYWYEQDGKRYAFTSRAAYQSWFPGTPTGVSQATIPDLATATLGGAVFHRPGERLVKFASSQDVYAVARYGMLRKLASEQVALELYGESWKSFIDEVSVTDYPLYRFGSVITDAAEYDRAAYWNVTNPSANAVTAQTQAPEKFVGTVSLSTNLGAVKVGGMFKLTATISGTRDAWNTLTIRFYDVKDQVVGTCRGTLACSVDMTAGGPVGNQTFTARAFNQYDQAAASNPVVVNVSNPQ